FGRRDAADPAPQIAFAAELLDVAHDLEKRLLQHVLRVLRPPQDAPHEIVDRRLESPVQGFEGSFISGLRAGDDDIGNGESHCHVRKVRCHNYVERRELAYGNAWFLKALRRSSLPHAPNRRKGMAASLAG